MSRLSSPPVIVAALLLLLAGAGALGWLWLRDGRMTPTAIVILFLPVALLIGGVTAWGPTVRRSASRPGRSPCSGRSSPLFT